MWNLINKNKPVAYGMLINAKYGHVPDVMFGRTSEYPLRHLQRSECLEEPPKLGDYSRETVTLIFFMQDD